MNNKKPRKLNNYDFCYGMGANWIDMDNNRFYHIQDYKEALDRKENPPGIVVTDMATGRYIETVDPMIVKERMKDTEPDPRY